MGAYQLKKALLDERDSDLALELTDKQSYVMKFNAAIRNIFAGATEFQLWCSPSTFSEVLLRAGLRSKFPITCVFSIYRIYMKVAGVMFLLVCSVWCTFALSWGYRASWVKGISAKV